VCQSIKCLDIILKEDWVTVNVLNHELFVALNRMRVLWLSGRVLDEDLCQTTQISLANGLARLGHDVTLACPGICPNGNKFKHLMLKRTKIKGFQSRSVANSVKKIVPDSDIIMVDWRLAPFLSSWLKKTKLPWYLVDRGPPADSGLLAKLQWRYWKQAWRMSKRGMAVSQEHKKYIKQINHISAEIDILRAGVNSSKFKSPISCNDTPRFVYLGKVDLNRGLVDLPQQVIDAGGELMVIGKGTALASMKLKWAHEERIVFLNSVDSEQVPYLLSKCDVGLLPMPNLEIWRTASPLKLAEYAAAGLLVAGVDHPGNNVPFDTDWLFLDDGITQAIESAAGCYSDLKLRACARNDAIEKMDWSVGVSILEKGLESLT